MSFAELRPAVTPDNIPSAQELVCRARALAMLKNTAEHVRQSRGDLRPLHPPLHDEDRLHCDFSACD